MTGCHNKSSLWSRAFIQTFGVVLLILSLIVPTLMFAEGLWPAWSLLTIGYGVAAGVSIFVWAEDHVI